MEMIKRTAWGDTCRGRASSFLLAPPPLDETALAGRTASGAGWVPGRLVVAPLPVALPARGATGGADAALDRGRGRSDRRAVVVRVGVRGAGARSEEWVRGRAGVAPWPSARGTCVRAGVFGSTGAGGVVADAVLDGGRAGGAGAEEVDGAAAGRAVGGADDGEGVAEDVADVEPAQRVRFQDRPVGVRLAVGAHVGYADLSVEARAEVGAAGCGARVRAAVEGVVGVLGVSGPGDGETLASVACSVGNGEDGERSGEEGQ